MSAAIALTFHLEIEILRQFEKEGYNNESNYLELEVEVETIFQINTFGFDIVLNVLITRNLG